MARQEEQEVRDKERHGEGKWKQIDRKRESKIKKLIVKKNTTAKTQKKKKLFACTYI